MANLISSVTKQFALARLHGAEMQSHAASALNAALTHHDILHQCFWQCGVYNSAQHHNSMLSMLRVPTHTRQRHRQAPNCSSSASLMPFQASHMHCQRQGSQGCSTDWIPSCLLGLAKTSGTGTQLLFLLLHCTNGTVREMHFAQVVTVNDYLARRDSEWVGQVHRFLGLQVGLVQQGLDVRFLT